MELVYKFEPENQRLLAYDGDKEVGRITYDQSSEDIWTVNNTFVDPSYQGQGIAGLLLDSLADQARIENTKIASNCSYVTSKFAKDPRYADVQA